MSFHKNLPNQITVARFLLALIYFGILVALGSSDCANYRVFLLDSAIILFTLCAGTDWLDGYFARKYNAITVFGRIADPMVDKILICGSFVFLASLPETRQFIYPWLAVLILAREFMVDGIRGFIESQGIPFPSLWGGKLKMGFQCAAVGVTLLYVTHFQHIQVIRFVGDWIVHALIWITVGLTIHSAYEYVHKATKLLTQSDASKNSST